MTFHNTNTSKYHLFYNYVLMTTGSGNAVAFTGMSSEIGLAVARAYSHLLGRCIKASGEGNALAIAAASRDCLLLAGAGSGVAANFDAPLAGAMFAYEGKRLLLQLQLLL